MVHFLRQTRGGKCEQMGCGPASVRYLTAEGFFYLCPGSGLFHKVFLQSQCVKEGCPADPEYGIILRIEKRKGKEENDIEMQAHCSAFGFVRAAAGLSDDGGSAGESG